MQEDLRMDAGQDSDIDNICNISTVWVASAEAMSWRVGGLFTVMLLYNVQNYNITLIVQY